MAMSDKTKNGLKGLGIIAIILGALFTGWKWVLKTNVTKLKDGKTIYMMGGQWYISDGTSKPVELSVETKDYMIKKDSASSGQCVENKDPNNPNGGNRQSNANARQENDTCLFGDRYQGYVDSCDVCVPVFPSKLACSDTGGDPDCFSQSDVNGNGYLNKSGGCSPCLKTYKGIQYSGNSNTSNK